MTLKVSDKQALDNEEEVIMISNDIQRLSKVDNTTERRN